MSKRETLAKSMALLGITRLLEALPTKRGLLVLNHHRIGNAAESRFDRGVFSATAEQLHEQVSYLKRRFPIVCGDALLAVLDGNAADELSVAITFDDGYLDNYREAFPVLQSHGVGGIFFLVPEYVGTATVPWWDTIAYLLRTADKSTITLSTPTPLTVTLEGTREAAIRAVLLHYKRPDNTAPERFLQELEEATGCRVPPVERRFLNWEEAAEMQRAGMEIGSHTVSHRVLSQVTGAEQAVELGQSKQILEQHLRRPITSLAYPVGQRSSFTSETERLAHAAGYRACFSFYGGQNCAGRYHRTDLLRVTGDPSPLLFRNEMALRATLGRSLYY